MRRTMVTMRKIVVNTIATTMPHVPVSLNKHVYARMQYLARHEYSSTYSARFRGRGDMQFAQAIVSFTAGARHSSVESVAESLLSHHDADCDGTVRGTEVRSLLVDLFTTPAVPPATALCMREQRAPWAVTAPLTRPPCNSEREAAVSRRIATMTTKSEGDSKLRPWHLRCVAKGAVQGNDTDDDAVSAWHASVASARTLPTSTIHSPVLMTALTQEPLLSELLRATPWREYGADSAKSTEKRSSNNKDRGTDDANDSDDDLSSIDYDEDSLVITRADLLQWTLSRVALQEVQLLHRPLYQRNLKTKQEPSTWRYVALTNKLLINTTELMTSIARNLAEKKNKLFTCINDDISDLLPPGFVSNVTEVFEAKFARKAPWEL